MRDWECERIWKIVQCAKRVRKQTDELFSPKDTLVGRMTELLACILLAPAIGVSFGEMQDSKARAVKYSSHAFTFENPVGTSYYKPVFGFWCLQL